MNPEPVNASKIKGAAQNARITIFRFDPTDAKPCYREYQVPLTEHLNVIGALFYLNAHADDPPAFRRFTCNRGQCAGCVMTINGRTGRACTTRVRDGMVLEPLYDYPVIKDLVVDFGTKTEAAGGQYYNLRTGTFILKSHEQRRRSLRGPWIYMDIHDEKCIACAEKPCVLACPVNCFENLEDRNGLRMPLHAAPIRIVEGRAKLAGVCNICSSWPCAAKCPTQAIQVVAQGAGTRIDPQKCIGCGLCLAACPPGNIWMNLERGYAVKCDLCGGDPECVKACPYDAIDFEIILPQRHEGTKKGYEV